MLTSGTKRILPYFAAINRTTSTLITKKCLFHNNNNNNNNGNNNVPIGTRLELTLAILKPHICKDPYSLREIRQIILDDQFFFVRSAQIELTRTRAEQFYEEHKGKFFYNRLVSFMCSGEIWVHILARTDAIARWRQLMGPTKVYRTRLQHPETIRGRFGATDTRNATHGSDSKESARKEIEFFFPKFSIDSWFDEDEPLFRSIRDTSSSSNSKQLIEFDEENWIHRLIIDGNHKINNDDNNQIKTKNIRV